MKGVLRFDPEQTSHRPGVRQLLGAWRDVDWFVPPRETTGSDVVRLFEEHHALCRPWAPEVYPERPAIEVQRGGWADMQRLAASVRAPGAWDWRHGALKIVSRAHSAARGWSPESHARPYFEREPGALLFNLDGSVIYEPPTPQLAFAGVIAPSAAAVAEWYVSYATIDIVDAAIWQLAEQSDDLGGNPFEALLRCYSAGYYPFGLAPDSFVLFAFEPDA